MAEKSILLKCRNKIGAIIGFFLYHGLPAKNIIFILSSMRAGSTLLKAVLAQGADVSHLPEVDFQKYAGNMYNFYRQAYSLSKKRIIVLKYPGVPMIPLAPFSPRIKIIVLIRDAYEVVKSIKERNKDTEFKTKPTAEWVDYWGRIYRRILESVGESPYAACYLRYEDLIRKPKETTKKLFAFIGSPTTEGTDLYTKPTDFEWKWGMDDGGENIKKLRILEKASQRNDAELEGIIDRHELVGNLRKKFRYVPNAPREQQVSEMVFI